MESVSEHGRFDAAYLVGVGWKPPNGHGFVGVPLPMSRVVGHSGIYCVQGGSFLEALDLDDEAVVVFTDGGDIVMQRPLTLSEWSQLRGLDADTVLVSWNACPGDTLGAEAIRLASDPIPTKFDLTLPCYNTGVIATTMGAYRRLYERYKAHWDEVDALFTHHARQQWLLSWILGTDDHLKVEILSPVFHSHGHYPNHGCYDQAGVLHWGGDPVLFRHKL